MFRRRRAVPPNASRAVAGPVAAPAHHHDSTPIDGVEMPYVMRFSAAWSWRLLLVVAAVYVFLHVFSLLSVVLVPVIIGLLISAALSPVADRLVQWRLPRSVATLLVVAGAIALIAALVALVAQQFTSGFGDLRSSFNDSLDKLQDYLANLGLSQRQLSDFFDKVQEAVQSGQGNLSGTVVKTATTAGHLIAGLFITLFATIFFTYDGRGIWSWLVSLFPQPARERVHGSGERAWAVLTSYVRGTLVIAATDAIGISLIALVLGLPLVVPLGVLVFLGAFIPVVGAAISGIVAVAVALVSEGPVTAAFMLAGVIAVQQIEGHVLQPFLMGRLVRVHPLAIIVVIAIGAEVAGIFGALIAVPLTAVTNAVSSHLASARRDRLAEEAGALADPSVTS